MRKSVFYLCAAIAAATVIAGCSKSSPETEGNEPTPPSTEDSTTTAMTLEDWCGTYEVQCTKTIVFTHSETGNNIYELVDEPQTFEITISMTGTSEADSTVEFTGWSALDFTEEFTIYPGLMKLTPEGNLKILANGRTEEKDIFGFSQSWLTYAQLEGVQGYGDGDIQVINNFPYAFEIINDGTSITSKGAVGYLNEEHTAKATVVGMEVVGYDANDQIFYYSLFQSMLKIPAGEFTFTKIQ